jgi:hypothetical protein
MPINNMTFKCALFDFKTEVESDLLEHQMTKHAANADKFGAGL